MNTYILLIDSDQFEHYLFQQAIDDSQLQCRLLTSLTLTAGLKILRVVKPLLVFIRVNKHDLIALKKLCQLMARQKFPGVTFNFYGETSVSEHVMQGDIITILSTREMQRGLRNYLEVQLRAGQNYELSTLKSRHE